MSTQRTAVLIHGFHLESRLCLSLEPKKHQILNWRDLAIGPVHDGHFGRATYGVMLAWREQADTIIFSTGASEKNGLKEAEYTYRAVLEVANVLAEDLDIGERTFREWLQPPRVRLDNVSQTTAEELQRNLTWCRDHGHSRVLLVTSQFHAPRALANANAARAKFGLYGLNIMACAPEDGSPAPVIFEPPTRPDRPGVDWCATLPGIFEIKPGQEMAAAEEIKAVLAKYKR